MVRFIFLSQAFWELRALLDRAQRRQIRRRRPASAPAQTTTAVPAPATTASLHGRVADPTGALIPEAQVTVANSDGVPVKTAKADAGGAYDVRGLAPGGLFTFRFRS